MKKLLAIVLLFVLALPIFAIDNNEKLDVKLKSHIYLDSVMLYGYPTLGGTFDLGLNIDTVSISAYLRFEQLFRPMGSNTGKLVAA